MATRSLSANSESLKKIDRALANKKWSQENLAGECGFSRQTAVKFCSGKPVDRKNFVSFCEVLELNWEEIAGLKTNDSEPEQPELATNTNVLVQDIRSSV